MRVSKDILKLVPNQSEVVKSLAEQYRKFAKASGEDILGLAEIVYHRQLASSICGTSRSSTRRLALIRRARQRASSKKSARS